VTRRRVDSGPQDWRGSALCAQTDPEIFFPEKGETATAALRVCAACEVRAECGAEALANGEAYGVWGGITERTRRRKLAAHRRATPTGVPAAAELDPFDLDDQGEIAGGEAA
jgi:WhiB family redox-sensing transcriptional regulator